MRTKNSGKRAGMLFGAAALLGLGVLAGSASPASARPRQSYRNRTHHETSSSRTWSVDQNGQRYITRDGHRYYDFPSLDGGYNRDRNYTRYGRGRDADRDGVKNKWDRDIDNDGRANWNDRDEDNDGLPNRRDRYPRNPNRR